MNERVLTVQLSPGAVARVEALMRVYGEKTPGAMISRAIGLLEGVQEYLHDGSLLVIDQRAPVGNDIVELVFDNLREKVA